jgi:hypothetical protein
MLADGPDHMNRHAEEPNRFWTASIQASLMAASAMVLSGWLAWLLVPARWNAHGYPSFVGYGKNVESAGLALGALTALAMALVCLHRPMRWRWAAPVLVSGWSLALYYGRPETFWALPLVLAMVALYCVWFERRRTPQFAAAMVDADSLAEPWPRWCSAMAALVLAAICFARAVWPIPLDGFHQGEVVLSALDWLKGGKPFETIFWPHGMHDTWLTAKLMQLTGNQGIGSVILSRALTQLVGFVTLQITALCLLRRWADAVVAAAVVTLVMPPQIYQLGVVGPAMLPLALLAWRTTGLTSLAAGGLLGCAYLWRFDSGMFGLAAAACYITIVEFYADFAAGSSIRQVLGNRHRWQTVALRGLAMLLGIGVCFAIMRIAVGLPTWPLLRMTLLELPRYHADNTGFPLSLPVARFDAYAYQAFLWTRWFTPGYLLLGVMLVALVFHRMARRRYWLSALSDRYFLAFGLFVLFQTKSMLDRAGPARFGFSLLLLGLLVLFDLLARLPRGRSQSVRLAWTTAIAAIGFGIVLPQSCSWGIGVMDSISGVQSTFEAVRHPRTTVAHLRKLVTPTNGWQDLIEPTDYDQKPQLHRGIREARSILESQEVRGPKLAVVHSGPILFPLLGVEPATSYYMLGWAMNDRMEHEAIAELESNGLRAILRINGMGAVLPEYDIPDEERVPIIDSYLKRRSAAWPFYQTQLGKLYVDPEAGSHRWLLAQIDGQWCVRDAERSYPLVAGSVQGSIDVFSSDGQCLTLAGWAACPAEGMAARRVLVLCGEQVVLAFAPFGERADVANFFSQPAIVCSGFDLKVPNQLLAAYPAGEIRLLAVSTTSAAEIPLPGRTATLASQGPAATTVK